MTTTKRKSVRFQPDLNTLAVVAPRSSNKSSFVGLVLDESPTGCRVAFHKSLALQAGEKSAIAVGKLSPIEADVVWRKEVSNLLCEVGFRYLE
jgi:hypothetical protein